jgi:hypothetical protein
MNKISFISVHRCRFLTQPTIHNSQAVFGSVTKYLLTDNPPFICLAFRFSPKKKLRAVFVFQNVSIGNILMKEKKKERVLSRNRSFAGDLLQNNHWDGSRSTLTYNFHTRKRKEGKHKEKEVLINKYIIVT